MARYLVYLIKVSSLFCSQKQKRFPCLALKSSLTVSLLINTGNSFLSTQDAELEGIKDHKETQDKNKWHYQNHRTQGKGAWKSHLRSLCAPPPHSIAFLHGCKPCREYTKSPRVEMPLPSMVLNESVGQCTKYSRQPLCNMAHPLLHILP